jgi:hypothetical protein
METVRWQVTLALGCVLIGVAGVGVGEVAGSTQSLEPGGDRAFAQAEIDADSVSLVADIEASGDASWEVVYRLQLDTDTEQDAFADLQSDIDTNESAYLAPFRDRIRRTATVANNATTRSMTVGEFAVSTRRESQPQTAFGLVTFSFRWEAFAAVDGDTIRAGDALDRLFLDDGESLQFRWPENYSRQSSAPDPATVDPQRVVWRGPVDFDTGQPRVVLATGDSSLLSGDRLLALAALGAILVLATLGWRRRQDRADSREESPDSPDDRAVATTDAGEQPPPELLSNEERILQLLERNGGRMKQQAVAEQLDWTAAKTSQVVATLREQDAIESFRLGRENVLTLPGTDITTPTETDDDPDRPGENSADSPGESGATDADDSGE